MICFGRTKIYALVGEGRLEAVSIGSSTRITFASVKELVAKATRFRTSCKDAPAAHTGAGAK